MKAGSATYSGDAGFKGALNKTGAQHDWEMAGGREQVRQCWGRKGIDLGTDSVTGLNIFHDDVIGATTSERLVLMLDQ